MKTQEQLNETPADVEDINGMDAPKHSKWETEGLDFTSKGQDVITAYNEEMDQEAWRNDTGWDVRKRMKVKLPVVNQVGGVSTYGEPITRRAAARMIGPGKWARLREALQKARTETVDNEDNRKTYERLLDTQLAVTFSRECLLFMLAQPECAGIKFYFCTNHEAQQSLVLVGVDGQNDDLGTKGSVFSDKEEGAGLQEAIDADEETLIYEVGGPRSVRDFLAYFESVDKHGEMEPNKFATIVGKYFSSTI